MKDSKVEKADSVQWEGGLDGFGGQFGQVHPAAQKHGGRQLPDEELQKLHEEHRMQQNVPQVCSIGK